MAYTIAVAGKGGVGKTTVCGMMIDALIKKSYIYNLASSTEAGNFYHPIMLLVANHLDK